MIGTLQTWQWAASDDSRPLREAIAADASVSTLARLRKDWSPEQIAVITELAQARSKARTKFPDAAGTILADREGLEMASSARAAAYKAARFREHLQPGTAIFDACCGIGGDSSALAIAGLDVTAIDLDERRAWMAGTNARCAHRAADIRAIDPPGSPIHIDPARRAGGSRIASLDDFEPPFDAIESFAARAPMAAIKLNPGVHADLLPPGELEIISERGTLTQGVLWTGEAAADERRATLLAADGSTHTIAGTPDRTMDINELSGFIHTMDPCLERAELVPALLETLPLRSVHPGTGLLTADEPVASPWVTPFRVHAELGWSLRGVKAAMRPLDPGIVTVKTRAGTVNPDQVSRQLRGKGSRELTVFVLPIGERIRAVVTERVVAVHEKTPPDVHGSSGGAWMEET